MALGDSAQLTPTNISITCSFAMNFQNYSVNMSVEDKDDNFVTSTTENEQGMIDQEVRCSRISRRCMQLLPQALSNVQSGGLSDERLF
jgi:hypothetical protein